MGKKVYLFATCLGTAMMGKTVMSAVSLLRREGIEVIYKKDQTCCGQPSYNTGYFEETKKIALYNVELFKGNYPILVPSGSCTGMMKHDYLDLFKDDSNFDKVKDFCSRICEFGNYLDQVLDVKYEDKGEPIKVTWHTNCHALRVGKSIESSKNLIRRLKNVEFVELEYEEECCGFGGTFAVKEPEISNAMVLEKIKDIKNSGCKYVISADGGCLMNIAGAMSRHNIDIKPIHLYDFIDKRLKGEAL
ncbi:(Fe-S)-binding protein [Campylobacter sp. RM12321]|uniref:(Fe-S)-binding protein n=1 Tax=Campylobacter sputorum TaxID=206 RepID=UPI000B76F736|nr:MULTISPECIES: (Fe-S)-binding protein [Campylobacter]ASM40069.1 NAD-independent L-lactate dehydrogenase LldEFG, oxidoreductase subunit [Campylobacter sputorum]MBF6676181.1 (Fe-S)-binding protein [Campylobacter sp. RM12321]